MKIQSALLLGSVMVISSPTFADEKNASGARIYKEACSVCHTPGVANAPKLGNQAAWKN